jgi:HSP20 family molecular chaperone IbpA
MNNQNLNKATTMGHILVDELQHIGHDLINNAIGLSVPIINTMAQTNLNTPTNINNINYYRNDSDDKILICCEIPGVSKENCRLNYSERVLKIQCNTTYNDEWSFITNKKYYREINVGIILNKNIKAEYDSGLLKITIMKHSIDIESNIDIN